MNVGFGIDSSFAFDKLKMSREIPTRKQRRLALSRVELPDLIRLTWANLRYGKARKGLSRSNLPLLSPLSHYYLQYMHVYCTREIADVPVQVCLTR